MKESSKDTINHFKRHCCHAFHIHSHQMKFPNSFYMLTQFSFLPRKTACVTHLYRYVLSTTTQCSDKAPKRAPSPTQPPTKPTPIPWLESRRRPQYTVPQSIQQFHQKSHFLRATVAGTFHSVVALSLPGVFTPFETGFRVLVGILD